MRHFRTTLKFACDGCDTDRETYCDLATVVRSPGGRALTITCPDCGAVKVMGEDACALARSGGTPTVDLTGVPSLTAGAQRDGRLSGREVRAFVDRLACTPDARLDDAGSRRDAGQQVVLSALWREVRDGVAP